VETNRRNDHKGRVQPDFASFTARFLVSCASIRPIRPRRLFGRTHSPVHWLAASWRTALALYSLASCGAIDEDHINAELAEAYEQQPEQVRVWIDMLGTYCLNREHKGPVEGWTERAAELDRVDEERQQKKRIDDLFGKTPAEQVG
jgi:hypothetical protein